MEEGVEISQDELSLMVSLAGMGITPDEYLASKSDEGKFLEMMLILFGAKFPGLAVSPDATAGDIALMMRLLQPAPAISAVTESVAKPAPFSTIVGGSRKILFTRGKNA